MSIKLIVYGEPKTQKRHRSARMGKIIKHYDPSSKDKDDFLWIVQQQRPQKPFEQPIKVTFEFYFSRPKSHYGTGSKSAILKTTAPEWHTSKPDTDNLQKFCMDAMNKVFWKDDSYICQSHTIKKYSDTPRIEITIETI